MYHCIAFCEASAESDRDEGNMSEDSKQISSKEYIAHINEYSGQVQSVKEHSENTARLCREFSVAELEDFMYALGLQHDIGKYQQSFQKRIRGANVRVEHSGCGALAAEEHEADYYNGYGRGERGEDVFLFHGRNSVGGAARRPKLYSIASAMRPQACPSP